MFASQLYGVEPDIVCLGKAIAAGFPMGGILAREEVASAFSKGDHGTTFGGNPLGCSVALASLEVIRKEKLAEKAAEKGKKFMQMLKGIKSGLVREVRGKGLLVGVETRDRARPFCDALVAKRVLTTCPSDFVIRLTPPLTITEKQLEKASESLAQALEGKK